MAKNNSSKPIPDFYKIFQLAEQYSEASILLEENDHNKEGIWSAPRVVVDSFAVELYLKCLFVLDNNKEAPHKHDWKILFDDLQSSTKNHIREEFNRIVNADPVLSMRSELKNLDVFDSEVSKFTDFDLSLDVAKDTFEKVRYLYDPDLWNSTLPELWSYSPFIREAIRSFANMIVPMEEAARNQRNIT